MTMKLTDDGFEHNRNTTISSYTREANMQKVTDINDVHKMVRYAAMMDEVHVIRAKRRRYSKASHFFHTTHNHTVIYCGLLRLYFNAGKNIRFNQTTAANRYGISREKVRAVLKDGQDTGMLDKDYWPTQKLLDGYEEFVKDVCKETATKLFARNMAVEMMIDAVPFPTTYNMSVSKKIGDHARETGTE